MELGVFQQVTHVVTATVGKHHVTEKRWLKVFQGVMKGAWVVSSEWVSASKKHGRWLPEEPFEVHFSIPVGLGVCPFFYVFIRDASDKVFKLPCMLRALAFAALAFPLFKARSLCFVTVSEMCNSQPCFSSELYDVIIGFENSGA